MDLTQRPRRLRRDGIRGLVSETRLAPEDLIAPVFVDATTDERVPIPSMPGQERVPVGEAAERVREITETGVRSVILFGVPESKDAIGSRAWAEDGVIQEATRRIDAETDVTVIADLCFCEYTEHGHCGVSQARAGADVIAPSGMADGQVAAVRDALDDAGFADVAIMAYAAKYASAFYGPFRDAADGAPAFGDRRHYQMDPANAREARREVRLDAEQGADVLMVKPALAYLDVVSAVRREHDLPVAAYNVSGEYAMVHAAAEKGWLDLDAAARESVLAIKRAGADLVVTYFAERLARQLG